MEIQRIAVGLELGELSDHAFKRARSLAREFGARLDIVHGAGVEVPHLGASRRAFFKQHAEQARSRALEAARRKLETLVEERDSLCDENLHVEDGPGAQALLSFALANGADLIVIGAHRHRTLFDFGSTGRAVLARSHCPVWVEPAEMRRFERVLAPIDLSPSTPLVLEAARSLAARFVVPVRVLHVFVPPEFAYDPMAGVNPSPTYVVDGLREEERVASRGLVAAFDWGELPVEIDHAEGEPATQILQYAGESDLIVMGTHGHTGLARAVLGSCAYRVLKRTDVPMIVIPPEHYAETAAK